MANPPQKPSLYVSTHSIPGTHTFQAQITPQPPQQPPPPQPHHQHHVATFPPLPAQAQAQTPKPSRPHVHIQPQPQPQVQSKSHIQVQPQPQPQPSAPVQTNPIQQTPKPIPQAMRRPKSPGQYPAPPHSPVSPARVVAQLTSMEPFSAPKVMAKPPDPVSIAESDNTDVIALRSALMILQVQREAAKRDIKTLAGLREQAVQDPEVYVKELVRRQQAGGEAQKKGDLLAPTLQYLVEGLGKDAQLLQSEPNTQPKSSKREQSTGDDSDDSESEEPSQFAKTPQAQNVYRMPPINWAKYHLSGTAFDQLHEDQRNKPAAGQPVLPGQDISIPPESYVLAAPYQPVVDAARFGSSEHPMQTRRGMRKM